MPLWEVGPEPSSVVTGGTTDDNAVRKDQTAKFVSYYFAMASRAITTREFSTMIQEASDSLSLVVRAHHSIETRIQEALEHELPRSSAVELRRVAFLLKVDFLVALGIFHPKFRTLFEQVNNIRNRFAHDPYATWETTDSVKVKNSIKAIDPGYPCESYGGDSLKVLLHVVFDYATRKYNDRIAERLRSEALSEMMTDPEWQGRIVPGHSELPPIPDEMMKEVTEMMDAEVKSRVAQKLASRQSAQADKLPI